MEENVFVLTRVSVTPLKGSNENSLNICQMGVFKTYRNARAQLLSDIVNYFRDVKDRLISDWSDEDEQYWSCVEEEFNAWVDEQFIDPYTWEVRLEDGGKVSYSISEMKILP